MQGWKKWRTAMLAVGLLCGGMGCATPPADGAAEERTSDRELESAILGRLNQEMLLDRASIRPSSDQGVVTLTGVVRNESQRMRAVAITRATPGVLGVIDHLRAF